LHSCAESTACLPRMQILLLPGHAFLDKPYRQRKDRCPGKPHPPCSQEPSLHAAQIVEILDKPRHSAGLCRCG
ncbi:hypothetical protein Q4595_29040, partial [Wenyingzhuangia sp. 1_MG-2023]|nr:hypothetical protein [Wenyingzhuangia sp. 1_MG-2023]